MEDIEQRAQVVQIVSTTPWLMDALLLVRDLELPDWCIGAGAIRGAIWGRLTGSATALPEEIDVAFFDPAHILRERDIEISLGLARAWPNVHWDVVNQAGVHLWYEDEFGEPIVPFTSLADAVGSWPEPATCVGVFLDEDDQLQVVDPLGLSDLFGLIVRRNPRVSESVYRRRLAEKRLDEKWPGVKVLL